MIVRASLAFFVYLSGFSIIVPANGAAPLPHLGVQSEPDPDLATIAVHVIETRAQNWKGGGVYLGNGFVLTAAHVVGSSWFTKPAIEVAGQSLPADIIRKGSFNNDDLTLLRIDEERLPMMLRLRHVVLCHEMPPPGSAVIIATPEGTARSKLLTPLAIPPQIRMLFPTLIPDVANTGNSGSGVFEATSQCLLGIMSRKISVVSYIDKDGIRAKTSHDIAKYFVPWTVIGHALPSWVTF